MKIQSTASVRSNGVKVLVYGQAGAGKTTLCGTLPKPIILSAEGGLLSLGDQELPFIEISSMEQLKEAYDWLMGSEEAKQFETVALDSLSEIAEVCLSTEKANSKDPRQAYGEMQDQMTKIIRAFRDLPGRNVYMSAKLEKAQNEMGQVLFAPSAPGKAITQALPYFFDEVFALRMERDQEGKPQRALLCQPDGVWEAKDRSGKLDQWEAPDLGAVFGKIGGK